MRGLERIFGAIAVVVLPGSVSAADPGAGYRHEVGLVCARAVAYPQSWQDRDILMREIGYRYHQAVQESEVSHTVYSRSERITWAFAARAACGKAWGHLSAGEVEPDRIRECNCAYDNMMRQGHISVRY